MKFFSQIWYIIRVELSFFARYPRLVLATAVVALIPAMYAAIYLSSVWDPLAHTNALPVGVVNQDQGVEYRGTVFNIGKEVSQRLQASRRFGFQLIESEAAARHLVRTGELAFALIIPPGFSSNAIPGASVGAGKLVVYTSEGNNFESAAIARHFAETLGQDVNDSLNERRWALVLSNAAGSQRSVEALRNGVEQLRTGANELRAGTVQTANGARTLSNGAGRLNDGVGQLTRGVKELGAGLKTMDAKRPANADLNRLRNGAETLSAGHVEFGQGLAELQSGSQKIRDGVGAFQTEAKDSIFVPAKVTDNLDKLADSLGQLHTGIQSASGAQVKLADGAKAVSTGVNTLTSGVRTLGGGIRTMVSKLPEDSQLDELSKGAGEVANGVSSVAEATQKVNAGAQRLAAGIELLSSSLPKDIAKLDGSAQGLAVSVQPVMDVEAAVPNSGSGFAPNVLPAALWLGAGIAAFLIHVRVLPRHAQFFLPPAQVIGKIALPSAIVVLQAVLLAAMVRYLLHIPLVHSGAFVLTLVISGVTFLLIVFALTRAFGDAGKGLAMILLAVQMSSSGGIVPIELSGGWYKEISPWLPVTWSVRALKASMFDAYEGNWQHPLLMVSAATLAASVFASWIGKWRFVKPHEMRAAIDV
ncbi:YhgE/Pip domain-containing protein [Rhodoferax aquaticus]|uniref:YhgE/Pip domain-containing protein n=1 Tax=Rhodoferax aquaticus TaxID=2527691 RepID=A0A515ESU7_9BURK|nr:YhgE/Pip domain-containing protein [Rhodoferax aquaticus]QDL55731.1 YhgE/Pip domain-containing protein [Rhodoferax aquaticus]